MHNNSFLIVSYMPSYVFLSSSIALSNVLWFESFVDTQKCGLKPKSRCFAFILARMCLAQYLTCALGNSNAKTFWIPFYLSHIKVSCRLSLKKVFKCPRNNVHVLVLSTIHLQKTTRKIPSFTSMATAGSSTPLKGFFKWHPSMLKKVYNLGWSILLVQGRIQQIC